MKAKALLLGILITWFLSSCEEFNVNGLMEDFGLDFSTDYYEIIFVIPPAPAGIEVSFSTPMQSDMDELLSARGYSNATITSVQMADASVRVDEGSVVNNLNAIDLIATSIKTTILPLELIASCENNTTNASSLAMETPATELADYLTDSEYTLITSGKLRENLTDTLRVKGRIRYRISLNVASVE